MLARTVRVTACGVALGGALIAAAAGPLSAARTEFANPVGVAVIIGNRTYAGDIPDVEYAHRDAEAFKRYVVDVLGFDPENATGSRRIPDCSVIPPNPSTEQSGQFSWRSHGRIQENNSVLFRAWGAGSRRQARVSAAGECGAEYGGAER